MHPKLQQKFDEIEKAHEQLEKARIAANNAEREHLSDCICNCEPITDEYIVNEILDSLDLVLFTVHEQTEILETYSLSLELGIEMNIQDYKERVLN